MKTHQITKMSSLISIAIFFLGCSGGSSNSPSDPSQNGLSCNTWAKNSSVHATPLRSQLATGGLIAANNGQLDLSYSGALSAFTHDGTQFPATALYSRSGLTGNFTMSFRLESMSSTSPDLAPFVAFQGGTTGYRIYFLDNGATITKTDSSWDTYGAYRYDSTGPSYNHGQAATFIFTRTAGTLSWQVEDDNGNSLGSGNFSGLGVGEYYLGFGIQNISSTGAAISGTVAVRYTDFSLSNSNSSCNAASF